MSWVTYDDKCADCQPAMLDANTGKMLPVNSKPMRCMMIVWNTMMLHERQAWHRFTCLNSRAPLDLLVIQEITNKFHAEMEKK